MPRHYRRRHSKRRRLRGGLRRRWRTMSRMKKYRSLRKRATRGYVKAQLNARPKLVHANSASKHNNSMTGYLIDANAEGAWTGTLATRSVFAGIRANGTALDGTNSMGRGITVHGVSCMINVTGCTGGGNNTIYWFVVRDKTPLGGETALAGQAFLSAGFWKRQNTSSNSGAAGGIYDYPVYSTKTPTSNSLINLKGLHDRLRLNTERFTIYKQGKFTLQSTEIVGSASQSVNLPTSHTKKVFIPMKKTIWFPQVPASDDGTTMVPSVSPNLIFMAYCVPHDGVVKDKVWASVLESKVYFDLIY